jgi:hypothetical protein
MKQMLPALLAMLVITGVSSAGDKPNFTGEWKMNPTKSNYGAFPAPTSMVRKITLADPSLVIVENQTGGGTDGITTRTYTTDGKSSSFEINGTPLVGSATWDGSDLTVITLVESAGLAFKDKMSLSSDGKELTSKVLVKSGQGDAEITIVFDRQ